MSQAETSANVPTPVPPRPGAWLMLRRALRLRCPICGEGKAFETWFRMRSRCPECDMRLDRGESDYFIGAYTLNLIVAELIVATGVLIYVLASWPDVPWDEMKWVLAGGAVIAPIVLYPFSKAAWLAIDLMLRPAGVEDFLPDR